MHILKLRQIGESVMMDIPPAFLNQLGLSARESVGIVVEGGRLIVEPVRATPHDSLAEPLIPCDLDAPLPVCDAEWTSGDVMGDFV